MIDATSQVQIHRGHIVLGLAWLIIFGGLFGYERLKARGHTQRHDPAAHRRYPRTMTGRTLLWSTAVFSAIAAAIHLSVIREHFQESALYGAFFLTLTAAQFGYTGWVLLRPSTALLKAGGAASAGIALLWFATRTIGIPIGPGAGEVEPYGVADIAATISETLLTLCALLAVHYLPTGTRATPAAEDDTATLDANPVPSPAEVGPVDAR